VRHRNALAQITARFVLIALLVGLSFVALQKVSPASGETQQIQIEAYKADRVEALHRHDALAAAALHREDSSAALEQTLIDKGLLALLVAIVGFIISRSLDRYQALLTADSAIESKRFEVLDDVWSTINDCEHLQREIRAIIQRGVRSSQNRRLLTEHHEAFESKAAAVRQKVDGKAHWLGRASHREITLYQNTLTGLLHAYMQGDVSRIVRLEYELAKRRQYVPDRRNLGARFSASQRPGTPLPQR
jgi:hypothetical protein